MRINLFFHALASMFLFFITASAFAQNSGDPASNSKQNQITQKAKKKSSLSFNARVQGRVTQGDRFSQNTSTLWLNTRTSDRFRFTTQLGVTELKSPLSEVRFINPEFRGFYRVAQSKSGFILEAGPTLMLPLSFQSRQDSTVFSGGLSARLLFMPQSTQTLNSNSGRAVQNALGTVSSGFLFLYDIGLNRAVHQFETSTTGALNSPWSLSHLVYGEYSFTPQFTFGAWGGFSSSWTYVGSIQNAIDLGQELRYTFANRVEVSLSHSRGGDLLSPSGQNYNFSLFDSNQSRFSVALTLLL